MTEHNPTQRYQRHSRRTQYPKGITRIYAHRPIDSVDHILPVERCVCGGIIASGNEQGTFTVCGEIIPPEITNSTPFHVEPDKDICIACVLFDDYEPTAKVAVKDLIGSNA